MLRRTAAVREVKSVAQVMPAIPGITVHFRVWDVDDPFDQLHGPGHPPEMAEIPGVGVIDNDRIGNDNRGGADPAKGVYTANTDQDGRATVVVTVSMQPGNNYRAGASCLADAIEQATQEQADALSVDGDEDTCFEMNGGFCGYQVPVVWSRVLTVWRKLHVETDSMWAVPTTVIGREPDWQGDLFITNLTVNATTTTLHLADELIGQSAHQYEGGRLVLDNGWSFRVRDHAVNSVDIAYVLQPAEYDYVLYHNAVIKDDDPDGGLLPHFFAMSPFIKTAYADAYIDIGELRAEYNPNRYVAFDLYLTSTELLSGWGWDNSKDVTSTPYFWAGLLVAGYQMGDVVGPVGARDNDPDPLVDNATYPNCPCWPGAEYQETLQTGCTPAIGDWESVIFRAAVVDFPKWAHFEDQVVAHEVGHSGGNVGTEQGHHNEGGLMSGSLVEEDLRFRGVTLKRFREASTW